MSLRGAQNNGTMSITKWQFKYLLLIIRVIQETYRFPLIIIVLPLFHASEFSFRRNSGGGSGYQYIYHEIRT